VGVDAGGDSFARVVEAVLYDLHRNAGFEYHGCPTVAEGMEADRRYRLIGVVPVVPVVADLGPLELPAETFWVKVVAVALGEYEVADVVAGQHTVGLGGHAFVARPGGEPFLVLERSPKLAPK